MRAADYKYNLHPDGEMGFRIQLPLGSKWWNFAPAADGQMGGIMKLYRDWQLSGDDNWLRKLWPGAKAALEYAWKRWDKNKDGVMEGIQHNTYDIEFHGPNTMMGTLYLGALKAAGEIAEYLGETEKAREYNAVAQKGRAIMDKTLFNGRYYIQKYDPGKAPKYQFGKGCLSDQLIGQWFAHLLGLGYLLSPTAVRTALKSVFRYNWKTDFRDHANCQRIYALNDEAGLLLCSWPLGGRPAIPFPYSDEVWCGIEYQVASHLIYEDLVKEGLAIIKGVRRRHDGRRRNPWNEFECGNHYARSMASYAVLIALSGYRYSAPAKYLSFTPKINRDDFRCFFTTGSGWGLYRQKLAKRRMQAAITIHYGRLELRTIGLDYPVPRAAAGYADIKGKKIPFNLSVNGELTFYRPVMINAGDILTVVINKA
jgi:hypothetical protein